MVTPGGGANGAQSGSVAVRTKVTIALPVLASVVMTLFYARHAGLFNKYGLDVDLPVFRGGPPANAALLSGDAQFLAADPYQFLKVAENGHEVRVLTLVHSVTFDLVASNTIIRRRAIDITAPSKMRPARLKESPKKRELCRAAIALFTNNII